MVRYEEEDDELLAAEKVAKREGLDLKRFRYVFSEVGGRFGLEHYYFDEKTELFACVRLYVSEA